MLKMNYKGILRRYGVKKILRKIGLLKPKKILYLSCHSVLEYDEILLLKRLGHYVFSPGDYVNEDNPGKAWLRPFPKKNVQENADLQSLYSYGKGGPKNKYKLQKELIKKFDIVIVMHDPKLIINNWHAIKHKSVVWRTIGQSSPEVEKLLKKYRHQGLKVVRYSPLEKNLHNFIGEDAIIRFYKNPNEFKGWKGERGEVLTIAQNMIDRSDACHHDIYKKVIDGLPYQLYGSGNSSLGALDDDSLSYKDLKKALQDFRCYFYTGTFPASYTLSFIEAWMTGIPIICIGNKLMHDRFVDQNLYEVPSLIVNGVNGFYADDINSLREQIMLLLNNKKVAKKISMNGRNSAIKHFGIKNITKQWEIFIDSI